MLVYDAAGMGPGAPLEPLDAPVCAACTPISGRPAKILRTLVGDAISAIVPPGKRAALLTELAHYIVERNR